MEAMMLHWMALLLIGSTAMASDTESPTEGQTSPTDADRSQIDACGMPEQPLDRSSWSDNAALTIQEATTRSYRPKWAYWDKRYHYRPDCEGWISDTFITGSAHCHVAWNLLTGDGRVGPLRGVPYTPDDGRACASWARDSVFPGLDLSKVRID
jgi:hypothetical protein